MVLKVMQLVMEMLSLSLDWSDSFEMKQLVWEREESN